MILVRNETSPEDVHGMHAAQAIVTAKGGMTSHAALVARGWGKTCVVGCGTLDIDVAAGTVTVGDTVLREGDVVTVNGTRGAVYVGELPLIVIDPEKNQVMAKFLGWCDELRALGVRTNADRPEDAEQARRFGAEGIGLCRTEHMFFGEERIRAVREMILAETLEDRERRWTKLLPFQRDDFKGLFQAMEGLPGDRAPAGPAPARVRAPRGRADRRAGREPWGWTPTQVRARVEQLKEANPMLGHRGCRLGISYPEVTRMQARAILEAAAELRGRGGGRPARRSWCPWWARSASWPTRRR